MSEDGFKTGHLAIVGRPNVGKSTLLNALVGQKISITSRKAQTTRHRIRGVLTTKDHQFVFVDTPGFQTQRGNNLNSLMNRAVTHALQEVDVVLFVVEAGRFTDADRAVLRLLPSDRPVILIINKIDRLSDKSALLPFIAKMAQQFEFAEVVPLSASHNLSLDVLLTTAGKYLPPGTPLFEADTLTDRSERFLAAELVREKLFRRLGEELPYGMTVEIEKFELDGAMRRIQAAIIVDKAAHKAMVIGKGGEALKTVASEARMDMEKLFDGKVFLEVWVKVKSGWMDDQRALKSLGYE